jgi:3'-phosphoadenosine 5'-phosphosulfate sulfotransferase (PAPS reductase)/FAD synthetase
MRRADALLHARTREYRWRVEAAQRLVSEALATAPSWYIALSGGKDSICVLELVREQAPDTPAVSSVYRWMLLETREYLAGVPNLDRVATCHDHGTGWGRNWESREEAEAAGCRWVGTYARTGTRNIYDRPESGVFLGLRADESAAREWKQKTSGPLFPCKRTGKWQSNPILGWTALDVWAFILTRGIRYNRAYDRMEEIGVPLERQRIGPFAVDKVLGYGPLAILKQGWPELWNEYTAAHPEARLYA